MSLAFAGRPSFWYDEAATISASYSRSLPELWRMLGSVDAVHGLYYVLMHGWFTVFPPTEFWARVPSGLAVGVAAAGVVVLGRQLSTRTVAVCAGVVCAVLPRSTWAGIEARPYALSMALAVWLSVALVWACRSGRRAWAVYGAVLAVSVLLDVYLALLFFVHLLFVACFRRAVLRPYLVTSVVVLAALAPFVLEVAGQSHQVAWIAPIGGRTFEDVALQQYFDRNPWFAVASLLLLVLYVVRRRVSDRELLVLAAAWLAVPTAVIVVYSAVVEPLYTPRYLSFTAPAVALMLGVCIAALSRWAWVPVAVVILLCAVAAPNWIAVQRSPYSKYDMDYSQVADHLSAEAAPGDCLLVDDTVTFHPAPMRPLLAARPDAYRGLVDVSLWERAADRGTVFDTNLIPEASVWQLERCRTLWIITQADPSMPSFEQGVLLEPGPVFGRSKAFRVMYDMSFLLQERRQFSLVQVILATRA